MTAAKRPWLFRSDLTGRIYISTSYTVKDGGRIISNTKFDVTDEFEAIVAARNADMAINVVFDGPPGHVSGRFVEVETDSGHGINAGEWIERPDGMWALRITELPGQS